AGPAAPACLQRAEGPNGGCAARTRLADRVAGRLISGQDECARQPARERTRTMAINQFIDSEVKSNDVVLFMRGTPTDPMCGFTRQVVQILDYLGVPYKGLNVLENEDLR